jgi:hypothetical protein
LAHTKLVLPAGGYFVAGKEEGHAFAVRIFDQVKAYCGMADWEVELVADDNPLAEPAAVSAVMVAPQKHALGTFGVAGNRIVISYVPALLRRPDQLIATLAHELAHYLLATAREPPPCEQDEIEFLTDLAAVYLGFGFFSRTPDSDLNLCMTDRCTAGESDTPGTFQRRTFSSRWLCSSR